MSSVERLSEDEYARLNNAVDSDLPRTTVGEVALAIVNERLSAIREGIAAEVLAREPWPGDGDKKCQRCYQPNIVWFADNDLWNQVMRETGLEIELGVVCLRCFAELCEQHLDRPVLHLSLEHPLSTAKEASK